MLESARQDLILTHVGIATLRVSRDPSEVLTAHSLGSCLGISAYDDARRVGGMVHCLLPLSKKNPEKAAESPCTYVDTGVAQLIEVVCALGASIRNLRIGVAGGASLSETDGVFEVGKNNYTVLRKILWKNQLMISAECVGGAHARTLSLSIATGELTLRAGGVTSVLK